MGGETYAALVIVGALVILFAVICADIIHKRYQQNQKEFYPVFDAENTLIGRNPNTEIQTIDSNNDDNKNENKNVIEEEEEEEKEKEKEKENEEIELEKTNKTTLDEAWDDNEDIDENADGMAELEDVTIEVNQRLLPDENVKLMYTPQSTAL